MANSSPIIPRGFTGIPHAGMAAGHASARTPSIPRGGNPFRQAAGGGFDEEGHLLPPLGRPGTVSGIIGRMMDKSDIEDFNKQQDVRNDAKQQKMQAGADAYWNAFQKGGNPDQALLDAVHPDNDDGHVHLMDKDTFEGMKSIYSLVKQAQQSGQQPTDFSTKDVGNGYSVLTGPGMKPQVLKPQQSKSGAGHYMQDALGNTFYTSRDNPTVAIPVMKQGAEGAAPEQLQGKQAALRPLSLQETNHLEGQRQAALALTKMQQSVGASGSLGYGLIERGVALHTFLSAPQAEAWNQAQNQLQSAAASMMNGSKLKKALDANLATLPKGEQANAFNANQALPALRSAINMDMADLYTNLKGQHKPTDVAQENMDMAGITPEYMAQVKNAQFKLQTAPNTLDKNELGVLQNERQHQLTTGDQNMRIVRQLNQTRLIPPEEFQRLAQKVPELLNTPPNEVRQNPEFWQPPQPAPVPGAASAPIPQQQPMPQQQAPQSQDSQGASAPIPPPQSAAPQAAPSPTMGQAAPMPAAPQQAAAPAPFNPIAAAQAAEQPNATPAAQAQPQPEETSSASAPIPPASPQENADIVSQHVDDVTKLIDSTKNLLQSTQVRPGVYSEQPDQLGAKKPDEEQ